MHNLWQYGYMSVLSIEQFAKKAGVSRRMIYRRIEKGALKTKEYTVKKIGIPESELGYPQKFIDKRTKCAKLKK